MKRKYEVTRENARLIQLIRDMDSWIAYLGGNPYAIYEITEDFILRVKENRAVGFDWEKSITADDLRENLIYFGNADFHPMMLLNGLDRSLFVKMLPDYFCAVWQLLR